MEQKKLTDRDPLLASAASANLIFYVVDGDDTTQDPEGSSFQISREQLLLALGLETSSGNQLLRGNYFPLPDSYDYFVWADRYKFNGIITNNYISDTLSLDAAHATLDRFDVLVLNNDHTFSVVKGTASANPAVPGINTETQISMAIIRVTADTTAPPEITSISAYKENAQTGGGEFDTATSGAAVILDSTEQASAGTKSIKFNSSISGDKATLTDDSSHNGSALTLLKLDVYITAVANYKLNITLNAADDNASAVVEIQDGLFGFNKNSLNEWQTVIIPAGSIPGIAAFNYNELVIENKQNNTTFYIDEVILQEGGSAISPTANYTLNLSGTNLQLLKDGVVHSVADLSGLVAAESLPPGGTTGQILKKQSNDDGDAYWEDEAAAPDLSGYQLKPAEGAFVDGDKTKLDALTNAEPPIDETYANITALIAAQNDQLEDWLYKVTDASDHPDVTTGSATFRYLGTTLGTVADYELEWKEEDKVLTNAEVETAYNSQVDVVLQAEAEAGTSTTVRRWTAERVKQAIYALAVKLSDFLEENLNGTADEALTVTGATNVDLSAAAHRNIKLTGNATLTFTNTPASGKTITRTYKIYSAATETLTIDNSTAEYGEYVADGTENMVTVMCSNTSTEGLDVHVFFTQPN